MEGQKGHQAAGSRSSRFSIAMGSGGHPQFAVNAARPDCNLNRTEGVLRATAPGATTMGPQRLEPQMTIAVPLSIRQPYLRNGVK